MRTLLPLITLLATAALTARAAIGITAPADKTYAVNNTTTITVTADASAATTTATLNGAAFPIGAATVVNAYGFHELKAESRTAGNVLVDSQTRRFIIVDPARNGSENGIPPHTPYKIVNDAPSAFAGAVLRVHAPAKWPKDLAFPVGLRLEKETTPGVFEGLRLNGIVTAANFPSTRVQMRRGWGSVIVPPVSTAGVTSFDATVNGITTAAPVEIEASTIWTTLSGTISGTQNYGVNARLSVTGPITLAAASNITIGAGSIVKLAAGATITVQGTLTMNGTAAAPIALVPADFAQPWGGFWLNNGAASRLFAYHTLIVETGSDQTWFTTTGSAFSTHLKQQAAFAVGTTAGAQLTLQDCFVFDLAGQIFAGQNGTFNITRTLAQRATTGGELNGTSSAGSIVNIDRSAIMEMPGETAAFVDGDNDGIYLTGGTHNLTRNVIGFTKDDGVDSGGEGATGTVTTMTNNWYEGTFHEGNSISGSRTIHFNGCVFFNCGQGPEVGYSSGSGSTGFSDIADVNGCLAVGNMVGLRFGDNYAGSYLYNGSLTAKGNISIGNLFKDIWGYDWISWTYNTPKMSIGDVTGTNAADRNYFTAANPLHPQNNVFNPATHGALLAPFMPVPGSNVGVAISTYAPAQADTSAYPGTFTVRLSTFSSNAVSVDYFVIGKNDPLGSAETILASGTLNFAQGETLKTISPAVASPGNYALIRVALADPVNAEVTGGAWYFKTASPNLITRGASGWRYRETRSEPPATWKTLAFDDTGAEWLPCTLPAGFGATGVVTTVASGIATDRTKAFYFRKKFTVADPAQISALTFIVRRDDAVVVWLNNDASPTVVSADGTFNPPYTYDATTIAANNVPNSTNTANYLTVSIPVSKLVAGQNILAIQLHQTSLTSGDIVLDCELVGPPLQLGFGSAGGQPILYWLDPAATLEATTDLINWAPLTGGTSPFPFSTAFPKEFFRLKK